MGPSGPDVATAVSCLIGLCIGLQTGPVGPDSHWTCAHFLRLGFIPTRLGQRIWFQIHIRYNALGPGPVSSPN